jgi:tRNA-dependent cyclodipeptide synthase
VIARPRLIIPQGYGIQRSDAALFGISVSDHPLSIDRNKAGIEWTANNIANFACLLGDSLYRMTLRIRHGWSYAITAGSDFIDRLTSDMLVVPKIIRTSRVLESKEFPLASSLIASAFNYNFEFRKSVLNDANQYCERQIKNNRLGISLQDAIDISIAYLLEEFAIYHLLAEKNWLVDVYPGPGMSTLSKLITGDVKGVSVALERRKFIELEFKER